MVFFDASAVVKAYVSEDGSATIRAVVARLQGRLVLSQLVVVEVLSTLAKQLRTGSLTKHAYQVSCAQFLAEVSQSYTVIGLPDEVFESASRLVSQHRFVSAGASDAVHVASALDLQRQTSRRKVTVASSDRGLLAIAKSAGLNTFDPEVEPFGALLSAIN